MNYITVSIAKYSQNIFSFTVLLPATWQSYLLSHTPCYKNRTHSINVKVEVTTNHKFKLHNNYVQSQVKFIPT
jgi:hypothetical protein